MQTKILLVEDSKIQRLANERILHKAGYAVLHAADGEQALRLARETIPDIVLLDLLLPKLGGPEVMRALRGDALTAQIPVLVFSSLPQANEAKLMDEGAAGYFQKSRLVEDVGVGVRDLIQLIENILRRSCERREPLAHTNSVARVAGAD